MPNLIREASMSSLHIPWQWMLPTARNPCALPAHSLPRKSPGWKRRGWPPAVRMFVLTGVLVFCAWAASAAPVQAPLPAREPPPAREPQAGQAAMHVKQVLLIDDSPVVLLLDENEGRYLPMVIDFFMANAISAGMKGPQLERPLTHDLIGVFLRRLGAKVTRITITELKNNTYYALISMQVNGEVAEFDARPSDALAIAVREGAAIFASEALLKPLNEKEQGGGPPPSPAAKAPQGKT